MYYDLEFSLQDIAEGLKITDTLVHERIVRALRKLRHPKYFDLIRYGMKTTVREMIRIESAVSRMAFTEVLRSGGKM